MSIYSDILNEADTYNSLLKKQASIGKLFPKFFDRVKAVAANGGVKLIEILPEIWHFKVNSGTKQGVKYDVYYHFTDIEEALKRWVPNRKMWLPDDSHVDYRKLAAEVMNDVHVEVDCSCKSDTFHGFEYEKTKRDSQYGRKEIRPPNIRNPKRLGAFCKHQQLVMDVLPFYVGTAASFLKKYWHEEIVDLEDSFKQTLGGMKQATSALVAKAPGKQPQDTSNLRPEATGSTISPKGEEIDVQPEIEAPEASQAKKPSMENEPTQKVEKPSPAKVNISATKPVGGTKKLEKPVKDKGKYKTP